MEKPFGSPLTAEALELQDYLRTLEENHKKTLTREGDALGIGRGFWIGPEEVTGDMYTGAGLCLYSTTLIIDALRRTHPNIRTEIMEGEILPLDPGSNFRIQHYWPRATLKYGTRLSIDATLGQKNPLLTGVVVDFTDNEVFYYGYGFTAKSFGDIRPVDVLLQLRAQARDRRLRIN